MSYIVVDHSFDLCSCFVCEDKRQEVEFENSMKELFSAAGFIPRNYDKNCGYNKYFSTNKELSKPLRNEMTAYMAVIKNENKEILTKANFKQRKRYVYCYDCGKLHLKNHRHMHDKKPICARCMNVRYRICFHCGEVIRREISLAIENDSKFICHKCFYSMYKTCDNCGVVTLIDQFTKIPSPEGGLGTYKNMCKKCEKNFTPCKVCGFKFFTRGLGKEKGFTCASCRKLKDSQLNQWEFKPIPIYWIAPMESVNKDSLMFGVELELSNMQAASGQEKVTYDNITAMEFISKFRPILGEKYAYCKTDSSVKYGFEIVTHPFSWDFYKLNTGRWKNFFQWARKNGTEMNDTTGMHVHLSKAAFSTCHLYKFINFFYSKRNRSKIYTISERTNRDKFNHYCPYLDDDFNHQIHMAKCKTNASSERHSAVNLMLPHTVEVRVFEAKMSVVSFFKNIEFCHAVFYFTKNAKKFDVSYKNFGAYVKDHKKEYPNLIQFIA